MDGHSRKTGTVPVDFVPLAVLRFFNGFCDTGYVVGLIVAAAIGVAASPAPLKTIVHVHASVFCAALHEHVAPAVLNLIENKRIVTNGKSLFLQLADDQFRHSMAIDLHMVQLNDLIGPMAQNLIAAQDALSKLPSVNGAPHTEEERRLVELRSELTQIVAEQNMMLNVFSGTYGSFTSTQLLRQEVPPNSHDDASKDASIPFALEIKDQRASPASTVPTKPAPSAQPSALPQTVPSADPAPPVPVEYLDLGLAGETRYATLFNKLTAYQVQELKIESKASQSILQAAALCR